MVPVVNDVALVTGAAGRTYVLVGLTDGAWYAAGWALIASGAVQPSERGRGGCRATRPTGASRRSRTREPRYSVLLPTGRGDYCF